MADDTLGLRLRRLRGERSRAEVARAVGISETALTAYESGLREPRDEVKLKLSNYYRCSLVELFFPKGARNVSIL